jgi:hypothetical protein
MDTSGGLASINTIMAQQAALLQEIANGTNRLVSSNNDILRYTRVSA